MDILGIGVSVWDTILLLDRYPNPGEVVRSTQRLECLGGGITVAIATAAALGSTAAMVDSIGNDEAGNRIIDALKQVGVETKFLQRPRDPADPSSTSTASIWSSKEPAERTIVYSPGTACDSLSWNKSLGECIERSRSIHLNGRHPQTCQRAIEIAKRSSTLVSFDGGAYRYREETIPMLRRSDIVIVARHYAESHVQASGVESSNRDLEWLADYLAQDLRCEIVGVTDGIYGSVLIRHGQEKVFQPAISPEEAIDTTGCGDTYHGAFLHAYVAGASVGESAALAAKISSRNARSVGGSSFAKGPTNP